MHINYSRFYELYLQAVNKQLQEIRVNFDGKEDLECTKRYVYE